MEKRRKEIIFYLIHIVLFDLTRGRERERAPIGQVNIRYDSLNIVIVCLCTLLHYLDYGHHMMDSV